jgi:hypothetical protein
LNKRLSSIALQSFILFLTILTLTSERAVAQDAVTSGAGWTSTRVDLDVTISPKEGRILVAGTMILRLDAASSAGPTLRLNSGKELMRFVKVTAPAGAASTINESLEGEPGARLAHIRFKKPLRRGAKVQLSFTAESTSVGFTFIVAESAVVVASSNGWYPQPVPPGGMKFDAELDKSTGITRFHLPVGWRSVSNGIAEDKGAMQTGGTETWTVNIGMPRSFCAGPYQVYRNMAGERVILMYLLSPKPTGGITQAQALAKALATLEKRFGAYPYQSYSVAEVPDNLVRWYGLEARNFTVERSSVFQYADGGLSIFSHEVGHGWWGNLVNPGGPGSYLLNEGLAQYSALIVVQEIEGQASYINYLQFSRTGIPPQQCARGYFEMNRKGKDRALSQLTDSADDYDLANSKGTWFYHMLRDQVGDQLFFATLRGLIRQYGGKTMTLPNLRSAFIAASPHPDELSQFFAQWLDRTGAPMLAVEWADAGSGQVAVTITQKQEGPPYKLTLEVAVDSENGPNLQSVVLGERQVRVVLKTNGKTTGVSLDPNHKLLIWRPEYESAQVK